VARATHAIICSICANHIENVGKQPLEQGGKYRVNENDEENLCGASRIRHGNPDGAVRSLL